MTDPTATLLRSMVRENTGRSMCDSGIYGYRYQLPIPTQPTRVWVHRVGDHAELMGAISTFHFLNAVLDYDAEAQALDAVFQSLLDQLPPSEGEWGALMVWFAGEAGVIERDDNTANYPDSDLDQPFHFVHFQVDASDFVVIRTHNGADVRAGYARPHVFRIRDAAYFYDWAITFYCKRCQQSVATADAFVIQQDDPIVLTHQDCGGAITWSSAADGW